MNKKQILVVEDEGLIAKDLQMMLRRLGYDVPVTVGTGELAIQTAIKNNPDLILMDIQLRGGMDGVQATEAIKSLRDIPVIFLTANSDELNFQRAKVTDPFAFLIKPFEERGLQAAIEMALYKNKTEKLIHEREQWLSTTMKSIADGVITTDESGRITFLNTVAEKLLGWNNDESLGKHHAEIFRLKDEDSTKAPPDVIATASTSSGITYRNNHTLLTHRSGAEIHVEYSAAQIRKSEDSIAGYVIVFSDMTQQRKLEEEMRQSQKMEVVGKLAGSIAHDFNNALTAIMGYSSMILSKLTDDNPMHQDAVEVMNAAEHSARLTRQLLAFSRKQIPHPVRLNLGASIKEMQGLLRRLIRENIDLVISTQDDLWDVRADQGHCEQLIFNMVVNARDAMPEGGKLSIDVKNVHLTASAAEQVKAIREGDYVVINISDTGTGMSEEIIKRIFEPFFTTKGPNYGTGLGLSTCDGVVRQAGGFIHVTSSLGVGTTFSAYYPKMNSAEAHDEIEAAKACPVVGGNETILFIENEESIRKLAARVLSKLGYTVIEVGRGCEAMAILSEHVKTIDLIITDLVLPDMSGRSLVETVRKSLLASKILLVSGRTDEDVLRDSIFFADVPFLQKPFGPEMLACKVREVLDAGANDHPHSQIDAISVPAGSC